VFITELIFVKANKNDMCKMNYSRLDKHDA